MQDWTDINDGRIKKGVGDNLPKKYVDSQRMSERVWQVKHAENERWQFASTAKNVSASRCERNSTILSTKVARGQQEESDLEKQVVQRHR